ncbi:MAG: hypothetical protein SX243_23315 [Acidobacteriota bacterium]|nr:hypothetical protein [Acidobacteriota bacterium]
MPENEPTEYTVIAQMLLAVGRGLCTNEIRLLPQAAKALREKAERVLSPEMLKEWESLEDAVLRKCERVGEVIFAQAIVEKRYDVNAEQALEACQIVIDDGRSRFCEEGS